MNDEGSKPPKRRNRTRQRERILGFLYGTTVHPTAADIFEALRPDFPRLSLGTVYRNLEVLISQHKVTEVPSAFGATRFDGNTRPHCHFLCEQCGRVIDVEVQNGAHPESLERELKNRYGVLVRRIQVDFHGICGDCAD